MESKSKPIQMGQRPTMTITFLVKNGTSINEINKIIAKMNEEHSGNYTLHYNITLDFS